MARRCTESTIPEAPSLGSCALRAAPEAASLSSGRPDIGSSGRGGIFSPRTWAEALYAVVDLAPTIAFFVVIVTLLSVGIGLTVIYVGIPILMLALIIARLGGIVQIGLAAGSARHVGPAARTVRPSPAGLQCHTAGRPRGRIVLAVRWLLPDQDRVGADHLRTRNRLVRLRVGRNHLSVLAGVPPGRSGPRTAPRIGVRSGGPTTSWTPCRG